MRLRIVSAETGAESFADVPGEGKALVVGRSRSSDIVIDDPSVSRTHARIFTGTGILFVEDSGSRSGTFVNDTPVLHTTPLSPGDVVRLGDSRITVENAAVPVAKDSPDAPSEEQPPESPSAESAPSEEPPSDDAAPEEPSAEEPSADAAATEPSDAEPSENESAEAEPAEPEGEEPEAEESEKDESEADEPDSGETKTPEESESEEQETETDEQKADDAEADEPEAEADETETESDESEPDEPEADENEADETSTAETETDEPEAETSGAEESGEDSEDDASAEKTVEADAQAQDSEEDASEESPEEEDVSSQELAETAPIPAVLDSVDEMFKDAALLCTDEMMALRLRICNLVLAKTDPLGTGGARVKDSAFAAEAGACLDQALEEVSDEIPADIPRAALRQAMLDELTGYGPVSMMLRKPEVTEIMVNGPDRVFAKCKGRTLETGLRFFSDRHLVQVVQRIVESLGRRVDDANPIVDALLPDGSRVNAIVPPLALDGASMTIRRFQEVKLTADDLIDSGSMTKEMALFLEEAVNARRNMLVSGGMGSGKTTLLNILSQFVPEDERIVTVEESAELRLPHRNIVRLEARPADADGKGRVTMRELVANSQRMLPDRIIVGELRGSEALEMLQALNTGYAGSMCSVHSNSPIDALRRIETFALLGGTDIPLSALRSQVASAIDVIVHTVRLPDGTRKVASVSEMLPLEGGEYRIRELWRWKAESTSSAGVVSGSFENVGETAPGEERSVADAEEN